MGDGDTALLLARLQFAFTITFHFIFPAFSIGLASYLAVLEGLWLRTGRDVYLTLFRSWLKIFAITFAMGVVSGITMSYQFGTNWSVFSDRAGPIIGPLMAYEVLTAFFLEAGFLGVMLFGLERVGKKLHFLATLMVAAGTIMSAFWILSVNSWMHTPTGWAMNAQGQFVPAGSWLDIIFNPSFPYRLAHTVIAAYLTTALAVGGAAAWHLLKERKSAAPPASAGAGYDGTGSSGPLPAATSPAFAPQNQAVRTSFSMAMWMAALVAPLQIVVGDLHALNTFKHQPAKILAIEGYYHPYPEGAPWHIVGMPDDEAETVRWAVTLPKMGSLGILHDMNAPMPGLDSIPKADRPSSPILFWSFRLMVGLGFLMMALGLWSLIARLRKR
ncbi:MAG: cytochrome ubiquinol oxidase subunit I, partial [Allosphingosinicella sp.]